MTQASRDRTDYIEISGTAAERAAFTNPKQAMEWYETDTTARYKYLSGAWVALTLAGGAAPGYNGGGAGGSSTIYNGQQAATGSAVALADQALSNSVVVQALPGNSGNVFVGGVGLTIANGYPLQPGQPMGFVTNNTNKVFTLHYPRHWRDRWRCMGGELDEYSIYTSRRSSTSNDYFK